jgi:GntR family transcriptional regulator/MocR family aminotransferase
MFEFLSCPVAAFEQHTLAAFIREGYFDRHINRLRTHYRALRDGLVAALSAGDLSGRCHPVRDDAGLHFLLRVDVPEGVRDTDLTQAAMACGLRIHTLSDYDPRPDPPPSHTFILNYSGLSAERIPAFAERLENTLRSIDNSASL